MKKWILALMAVALALPSAAWSADLPGFRPSLGIKNGQYWYSFTTANGPGVYSFGAAFPVAVLDFEFGSAFDGTLYACDAGDSDGDGTLTDEAGCTSLVDLDTADVTKDPLKAKKPGYFLEIDTAGTATLTIKGTWDQVVGGAIDVFVGGSGDVADVANPNDTDGDHTYDNAVACSGQCFFQSSSTYGGGWWAYTGSAWSPMNELPVFWHRFESVSANWNSATWGSNACIFSGTGVGDDDAAASCADAEAAMPVGIPYLFTRWAFVPAQASEDTTACEIRILTDNAETALSGSEFNVGETAYADLTPIYSTINATHSGGEMYWQFRDGGTCVSGTGATCDCDGGNVDGGFVLYGIPIL